MPMRLKATLAAGLLGLLLCGAAPDERLSHVVGQLTGASDPRARAQAALLLARFTAGQAAEPLCNALDDPSTLVRGAAAKALGALRASQAASCLARHRDDHDPAVKAEVAAALAALQAPTGKARVYVALGAVLDKSGKLGQAAVDLAERELRAALAAADGVQVAPRDEARAAGDELIRKRGLKGFVLNVVLEEVPDGTVRMDALCLTFSDRKLLGQVTVGAKGARAEELIRALAPALVDRAGKTLEWSSP